MPSFEKLAKAGMNLLKTSSSASPGSRKKVELAKLRRGIFFLVISTPPPCVFWGIGWKSCSLLELYRSALPLILCPLTPSLVFSPEGGCSVITPAAHHPSTSLWKRLVKTPSTRFLTSSPVFQPSTVRKLANSTLLLRHLPRQHPDRAPKLIKLPLLLLAP